MRHVVTDGSFLRKKEKGILGDGNKKRKKRETEQATCFLAVFLLRLSRLEPRKNEKVRYTITSNCKYD